MLVVDEEEFGSIALSSYQPYLGTSMAAVLADPDGVVGEVEWVWHRNDNPSRLWASRWEPVTSATSSTYTTVEADLGSILRVTATYDDGQGPGKSVHAVSQTEVVEFRGPLFLEAQSDSGLPLERPVARGVAENAGAGENVGGPVIAVSPDGGTLVYTLSGEDAALFDIDSRSGQISVKAGTELDYEGDRGEFYAVRHRNRPIRCRLDREGGGPGGGRQAGGRRRQIRCQQQRSHRQGRGRRGSLRLLQWTDNQR